MRKILYSISIDDVKNVSKEMEIPFKTKDIGFIEDKIGEYFNSTWYDAIEFALNQLENQKNELNKRTDTNN